MPRPWFACSPTFMRRCRSPCFKGQGEGQALGNLRLAFYEVGRLVEAAEAEGKAVTAFEETGGLHAAAIVRERLDGLL